MSVDVKYRTSATATGGRGWKNPDRRRQVREGLKKRWTWAAIVLSEELDRKGPASRLNLPGAQLNEQIAQLELRLCLHIFEPGEEIPRLTNEWIYLIGAFRQALAVDGGG